MPELGLCFANIICRIGLVRSCRRTQVPELKLPLCNASVIARLVKPVAQCCAAQCQSAVVSGTEATIGWIKFKRGIAFNSTVLFEATGVRAACSAALPPEPSLRASIALLQEGL